MTSNDNVSSLLVSKGPADAPHEQVSSLRLHTTDPWNTGITVQESDLKLYDEVKSVLIQWPPDISPACHLGHTNHSLTLARWVSLLFINTRPCWLPRTCKTKAILLEETPNINFRANWTRVSRCKVSLGGTWAEHCPFYAQPIPTERPCRRALHHANLGTINGCSP